MIVTNNKKFVTYIGDIYLYPGNNEINAEKSKTLLASEDFNAKVKAGMFTIVGAEKITNKTDMVKTGATKITPATTVAAATISGLNVAKAAEVIAGIYNIEELNRLKESDTRKGVHEAIERQLAILQADDGNNDDNTDTDDNTGTEE